MSFQEKRILTSLVGGVATFLVYFGIVLARYRGLAPDVLVDTDAMLRFWASALLIYIPIAIVVRIVFYIVFMIMYRITVGEDAPHFEDERDKLIELKTSQISQAFFVLGFVGSMVPIVTGGSVTMMFVILIISGLISEIVGETVRIGMYRWGV
jgi:hypothetical protein